jgi:hypothetical protein
MKHFLILLVDQSQFEAILGRVNDNFTHFSITIQGKQLLSLDSGQINGLIQGANNAIVTLRQGILDVVQCAVKQHAGIIPSGTLDANGFVDLAGLLQFLCCDSNGYCYV